MAYERRAWRPRDRAGRNCHAIRLTENKYKCCDARAEAQGRPSHQTQFRTGSVVYRQIAGMIINIPNATPRVNMAMIKSLAAVVPERT